MSSEKTAQKAGTFVAAWKRGGYCLIRRSCISQVPYLGALSFAAPCGVETCGSYTNGFSAPVHGSMIGGRKVSAACGMWKVKVFTWRPMRDKASMRAGLLKEEGLNVTVMFSKRRGAAFELKSWHTKRSFGRSSDSRWSSTVSRHVSFSQKRRKTEEVERTRLHIEPLERIALACQCCFARALRQRVCILHRPSTVVAGVNGISPKSNLELARDTVVAALPWLFWLSPEYERLSDGGVGR
jgi:hypothetical protein